MMERDERCILKQKPDPISPPNSNHILHCDALKEATEVNDFIKKQIEEEKIKKRNFLQRAFSFLTRNEYKN
jgi:hypothetical protein